MLLRLCIGYRSNSLASRCHLAAPRQPLSLLYPSGSCSEEHTSAINGISQLLPNQLSRQPKHEERSAVPYSGLAAGVQNLRDQYRLPTEPDTATPKEFPNSPDAGHSSRPKDGWNLVTLRGSFDVSSSAARKARKTEQLLSHPQLHTPTNAVRKRWKRHYEWHVALVELKARYRPERSILRLKSPITLIHTSRTHRNVHVLKIRRPAVWSTWSFAQYVVEVTGSRCSWLRDPFLYSGRTTHEDEVGKVITTLFKDDSLRSYLSPHAFDTAIRWLCRHGQLFNVSRLLRVIFELNIPVTITTWNTILWSVAQVKDLDLLTELLRIMHRRGVSPDAYSWLYFLMALKDNQAKLYVIEQMREAGALKDPAIVKSAFLQVLHLHVSEHVDRGQSLELLLQHLNSLYGTEWMSFSAGIQIYSLLSRTSLTIQASSMLSVMQDRGISPKQNHLHIVLAHCRRLCLPKLTLEALRLFHYNYGLGPVREDYDILFHLAWRSRYLNTCKVIWRVACLRSAVGRHMQKLLLSSLTCKTAKTVQTRQEKWMKTAGREIVGIDHCPHTDVDIAAPGWEVLKRLSRRSKSPVEPTKTLVPAITAMTRDMRAGQSYVFAGNFIELYEKALELDIRWEREKRHVQDTLFKIEPSIEVPFLRQRGRKSRFRVLPQRLEMNVPPKRTRRWSSKNLVSVRRVNNNRSERITTGRKRILMRKPLAKPADVRKQTTPERKLIRRLASMHHSFTNLSSDQMEDQMIRGLASEELAQGVVPRLVIDKKSTHPGPYLRSSRQRKRYLISKTSSAKCNSEVPRKTKEHLFKTLNFNTE
jgi:hypothetical protein